MFEATKTRAVRGEEFARTYFSGTVLDIGCGPDLVAPHAQPFDVEQGDANEIRRFLPPESFDCVHSSHCLEHMSDPPRALEQWWSLVRPGGFLVVVVPEENLYEQGIWPSIFNSDHKATFRLGRASSWSPVSYDIRRLVATLPHSEVVDCSIQDSGYVRQMFWKTPGKWKSLLLEISRHREAKFDAMMKRGLPVYQLSRSLDKLERLLGKPFDQTATGALAQIQVIARKLPT